MYETRVPDHTTENTVGRCRGRLVMQVPSEQAESGHNLQTKSSLSRCLEVMSTSKRNVKPHGQTSGPSQAASCVITLQPLPTVDFTSRQLVQTSGCKVHKTLMTRGLTLNATRDSSL